MSLSGHAYTVSAAAPGEASRTELFFWFFSLDIDIQIDIFSRMKDMQIDSLEMFVITFNFTNNTLLKTETFSLEDRSSKFIQTAVRRNSFRESFLEIPKPRLQSGENHCDNIILVFPNRRREARALKVRSMAGRVTKVKDKSIQR